MDLKLIYQYLRKTQCKGSIAKEGKNIKVPRDILVSDSIGNMALNNF